MEVPLPGLERPFTVAVKLVIVHSLSSGKVKMFLCAACYAFTPHVHAWKRWTGTVVQV